MYSAMFVCLAGQATGHLDVLQGRKCDDGHYEQTFNQICSYVPYVQAVAYAPVGAKGNNDDEDMYRHRQWLAFIPLSVTLTWQGVNR